MDHNRLRHLATKALGVARDNLEQDGGVLPVLITFASDETQKVIPVPDKYLVGGIIRQAKPDAFVYVAETWVRDYNAEEEKLSKDPEGQAELQKLVQEGLVLMPSQSTERKEGILLIGGTGTSRVTLTQRFRREAGKIVFELQPEFADIPIGDSLVDWDDTRGRKEDPTLWKAAPPGGRRFPIASIGFEIWIPEGWRMNAEPDVRNPSQKHLIWYREKDPHGAVRLTNYSQPSAGLLADASSPLGQAKRTEARLQEKQGVENVRIEDLQNRAIVSWVQKVPVPNGQIERVLGWMIHDSKGALLLTFGYSSKSNIMEVEDELSSVREIVTRTSRL